MKYMGSKTAMLRNGLGATLLAEAEGKSRFVDLFAGSAAVSWFVGERARIPVLSVDLQTYSRVLALSIVGRTSPLNPSALEFGWLDEAEHLRRSHPLWSLADSGSGRLTRVDVERQRELCRDAAETTGTISAAYGGYYLSVRQAVTVDSMLQSLPNQHACRDVCVAAIILAASRCVASPGHTAQPFRPTERALPHIEKAWGYDVLVEARRVLKALASRHAKTSGAAITCDAMTVAGGLNEEDLVFLDPPYSSVHYSRFYHVYETIARGYCDPVSGAGRYPPAHERPSSDFSIRSSAQQALENLLSVLASTGSTVVLTFPSGACSNGISGTSVLSAAESRFIVGSMVVDGKFSTLGGNNRHRAARHASSELLLVLTPAR